MSSPLGAVIDDLASDTREFVAVNPPADDEPLAAVLSYFERFDVSAVRRTTDATLPEGTLVVTDGDRTLAAADIADLHTYLFEFDGVRGGDPIDIPPESMPDPGPEGDTRLTATTVEGIQQFLARLDNRVYTVTGESVAPMVGVSRHIEQRAFGADDGAIHAGFQNLSRLRDHPETLKTYRRLADHGVGVNIYGVPDWKPTGAEAEGLSVYGDADGSVVGDVWFVAVDSEDYGGGALVAREDDPGTYTGFWTFRPPLVEEVLETIERRVQPKLTPLSD